MLDGKQVWLAVSDEDCERAEVAKPVVARMACGVH